MPSIAHPIATHPLPLPFTHVRYEDAIPPVPTDPEDAYAHRYRASYESAVNLDDWASLLHFWCHRWGTANVNVSLLLRFCEMEGWFTDWLEHRYRNVRMDQLMLLLQWNTGRPIHGFCLFPRKNRYGQLCSRVYFLVREGDAHLFKTHTWTGRPA